MDRSLKPVWAWEIRIFQIPVPPEEMLNTVQCEEADEIEVPLHAFQQPQSKAEEILLASLQIEKTSVAYRGLGDISMNERKPESAIRYYDELAKFPADPADAPQNAYMRALAYLLAEKPTQAMSILQQTVARYPAYRPAAELLARVRLMTSGSPRP